MTLKFFTGYVKKLSDNFLKKFSFRIRAKIADSKVFYLTPSSGPLRLNKVECDYGFSFLQAIELLKAEAEICVKT